MKILWHREHNYFYVQGTDGDMMVAKGAGFAFHEVTGDLRTEDSDAIRDLNEMVKNQQHSFINKHVAGTAKNLPVIMFKPTPVMMTELAMQHYKPTALLSRAQESAVEWLNVKLPKVVFDEFISRAKATGTTQGDLARQIIEDFLSREREVA